jgi:TolB-like protein/Tfp pilus assembly protein PilF
VSFFNELKRRNVFRVGIAYVVIAWLLAQVADLAFENFGTHDWAIKTLLLILVLGFPLALFFAWAFELTPEGIKKEKEVDRSQSITPKTGRKLDYTIIALLVLALGYFIWESRFEEKGSEPISVETVSHEEGAVTQEMGSDPNASIAVLPFADLSAEGDQEYFADGISEELLNVLVRVEGLTVASRTSSFAFKGQTSNISQIAEELKVNHVLEGSVRKAGNRVRITAQLIDAATDRHLWSDTFDRELVDIFAIQDEIANAIVTALRSTLGIESTGKAVTVTADTENLDAYELYLKGRALFIARDQLEESIRLLERAVELDPNFARAWESLGAIYGIVISWGITDREYDALAAEATNRALELNPNLSMPWATLGLQSTTPAKAMEYFDQAIKNDPKNSTAYLWRAIAFADMRYLDRAIADVDTCLSIDPHYENCRRHKAAFLAILGDGEQALELYQEGVEYGFKGLEEPVFQLLMQEENRLAVAHVLWDWVDDRTYPVKAVLDAIEFPGADHSAGLDKFMSWLSANDEDVAEWSKTLIYFDAYDLVDLTYSEFFYSWLDDYKGYRQSKNFKSHLNSLNIPAHWRENGFPSGCRSLGTEGFECD